MNLHKESVRRQSPLLLMAIPLALGMALSERVSDIASALDFFFVAALFAGTFSITASLLGFSKSANISFAVFVFFGGAFHFLNFSPPKAYEQWNTRDAHLVLLVERADVNEKMSAYGVARVVSASEYFNKSVGTRIWFNASDSPEISRGDEIEGVFTVRSVMDGGFDAYLNSQRIFFKANAVKNPDIRHGAFPYSFYRDVRASIVKNLSLYSSDERAASAGALGYRAMVLGDKGALTKEAKNNFAATGTMHIFAISGLHVALIAASIYWILNLLRLPRKIQPLICLPALFLYVNACGAPPSAMRAFLMIALVWLAISFSRKPKPFAGFVAAFTLSLLIRPTDLFDAGFTLSYAVVAAILLCAVPMYDAFVPETEEGLMPEGVFPKVRQKITRYILIAFAISFAALFASAPLSSAYFGYIAPLSLPFSIPYVAGSSIVITLGLFAMILPGIFVQYTNAAAALITSLMIDGAELGAQTGFVINVKISGLAAFLIESAIICVLLIGYKIPGKLKWAALPAVASMGVFIAAML